MNGATFIVVALISLAVLAAVLHLIRNAKEGKSLQCGADCSHCAMDCHKRSDIPANEPAEDRTNTEENTDVEN